MSYQTTKRISWDDLYMSWCFILAQRSPDPSSKFGCVIVDDDMKVIGAGYNGSPSKCDDTKLPWDVRPYKYAYVIHSEENAILNSNSSIKDSTVYVSGMPCHKCIARLMQCGVKRIVYADIVAKCCDEQDQEYTRNIMKFYPDVSMEKYSGDLIKIFFQATDFYIDKTHKKA